MTTVIVLRNKTTNRQRDEVVGALDRDGVPYRLLSRTLISSSAPANAVTTATTGLGQVANVYPLSAEYPRAGRGSKTAMSTVRLGEAVIGGAGFTVIAGPCSVETLDQMMTVATACRAAGAHALRGGVFKPRTSPYSFQGLGRDGLALARAASRATGLPFVTEVVDCRDVEVLVESAHMLQIGARNMQNYPLLREVGTTRMPVLLKRGLAATVDETLLAAEYILNGGNDQVVICERGIRAFETSYRFTLDLTAVTVFRERTHLPVLVDPSHAAGERARVIPLALAAAASGADGIIVETHCDPAKALCDGKQALHTADLPELMRRLHFAVAAAGRRMTLLPSGRPALAGGTNVWTEFPREQAS